MEAPIAPQPLSPGSPAFCILLSLVNGEKHGYAILKDVEALSDGGISLSTSTLYEALSRLLEQGLIERVETGAAANGRRVRKAYRLSRLGRQALDAETARLETLVQQAHRRLLQGES
jgi:DNA-binding PadR family transcriptional regulator